MLRALSGWQYAQLRSNRTRMNWGRTAVTETQCGPSFTVLVLVVAKRLHSGQPGHRTVYVTGLSDGTEAVSGSAVAAVAYQG